MSNNIILLEAGGIRTAAEIHSLTKFPICRNLKKIEETGDVKHKGVSGHIKKNNSRCFLYD